MDNKWTDGPWTLCAPPWLDVKATKDWRPVLVASCEYRDRQHPGSMVLENEGLANARLIAAAPDLYAALRAAMPDLRGLAVLHGTLWFHALVKQCDAALSAARGEV